MEENSAQIITVIDELFKKYNRDSHAFTVDYDKDSDNLYCYYVPFTNDTGFVVLDDFLNVGDTSQAELRKLKEYMEKNSISSRHGHEWDVMLGWKE